MAGSQSTAVFQRVQVALPRGAGPVLTNIASVFGRQLQRRCGAVVVRDGAAPFTLELAIEPGIGKEGLPALPTASRGALRIAGNDERGVLYRVGKFLRTSRYEGGSRRGLARSLGARQVLARHLLRDALLQLLNVKPQPDPGAEEACRGGEACGRQTPPLGPHLVALAHSLSARTAR